MVDKLNVVYASMLYFVFMNLYACFLHCLYWFQLQMKAYRNFLSCVVILQHLNRCLETDRRTQRSKVTFLSCMLYVQCLLPLKHIYALCPMLVARTTSMYVMYALYAMLVATTTYLCSMPNACCPYNIFIIICSGFRTRYNYIIRCVHWAAVRFPSLSWQALRNCPPIVDTANLLPPCVLVGGANLKSLSRQARDCPAEH